MTKPRNIPEMPGFSQATRRLAALKEQADSARNLAKKFPGNRGYARQADALETAYRNQEFVVAQLHKGLRQRRAS